MHSLRSSSLILRSAWSACQTHLCCPGKQYQVLKIQTKVSTFRGQGFTDRTFTGRAFASRVERSPHDRTRSIALFLVSTVSIIGGLALLKRKWPSNRLAGPRPTDEETLASALEMLEDSLPWSLRNEHCFVDLGSGDGRVVNAVVRHFGCHGVGVELMEDLVAQSRLAASSLPPGRAERSVFLKADISVVDLTGADVLYIYLPRNVLRPVLTQLIPQSHLRIGAAVLIVDAPNELHRRESLSLGLKHIARIPCPDARHPPLDLYEWRAGVQVDRRLAKVPEKYRVALPLPVSPHNTDPS